MATVNIPYTCFGVYAQIIQRWKTLLSKIAIRNFCACTQKSSTSLLRICVYAQIIQCWKTSLSEIIIRNLCACTQKSSTSLLRICVYAQKIQQMIIIKSSNNPIVDVLRPVQKLKVWNMYIPETTAVRLRYETCWSACQYRALSRIRVIIWVTDFPDLTRECYH